MKNKTRLLPIVFSLVAMPLGVFAQDEAAKPVQGKVIAVTGSNVVINAGSTAGIKGGEKLLVTAPWEIVHSNGKKAWKGEREVGFLRVLAVSEDQALADLISGNVTKGDNVQVVAGLTEPVAEGDDANQRLNAWLKAYNNGEVTEWVNLLADDAEWSNPDNVLRGKAEIWSRAQKKDWERARFIESRRIVYGDSIAWEGTFEASDEASGEKVKRPMVMMIDFNQDGKIKRLNSYYDLKSGSK